jgi:hypothetical protein
VPWIAADGCIGRETEKCMKRKTDENQRQMERIPSFKQIQTLLSDLRLIIERKGAEHPLERDQRSAISDQRSAISDQRSAIKDGTVTVSCCYSRIPSAKCRICEALQGYRNQIISSREISDHGRQKDKLTAVTVRFSKIDVWQTRQYEIRV